MKSHPPSYGLVSTGDPHLLFVIDLRPPEIEHRACPQVVISASWIENTKGIKILSLSIETTSQFKYLLCLKLLARKTRILFCVLKNFGHESRNQMKYLVKLIPWSNLSQ